MVELTNNELVLRFPHVHESAVCKIKFMRTLRIPDDNKAYPLPAGLGLFPMAHVEDHAKKLPTSWAQKGGVLLPMYQAEAMWISFESNSGYPFAVKIAAGKINAVTGQAWSEDLEAKPQDYVVLPEQSWLDGFCVQKGLIRQFVAMPLGGGYTAEEQLSQSTDNGGLQIIVYPMKRELYLESLQESFDHVNYSIPTYCRNQAANTKSMGLAAGGLMRQEISADNYYGFKSWDMGVSKRCFVHILNSTQWATATGLPNLQKPLTINDYEKQGLPWFEKYDETSEALDGATLLAGLDSVAAKAVKLGHEPLQDNESIKPKKIISLSGMLKSVKDGLW
jgi:hypothetical protein